MASNNNESFAPDHGQLRKHNTGSGFGIILIGTRTGLIKTFVNNPITDTELKRGLKWIVKGHVGTG